MWNLAWALPGTFAVAMIWLVSALANYQFGLTQGTTEAVPILFWTVTTSAMNGYASLAVDVLKVTLPATAVVAWVMQKRAVAVGIAAMFTLCLAWSAQNSIGYVLSNHSRAVDGRGQTADQWAALQKTIDEAQRSRGLVPEHRPAAVANAEIAAIKASDKFAESAGCTKAAAAKAINFCDRYRGLTAELAAAESADKLDVQLASLRRQLDNRKRISDSDPAAGIVAGVLGMQRDSVVAGRSVSFSLLVEVISAAGLAMIWGIFFAAMRDSRAAQVPQSAPLAAESASAPSTPVQPTVQPRTPPSSPPGSRKTTKRIEIDAEDNVVPFSEKASDFFEESDVPKKLRREHRKHWPLGSAKEWLRDCTERTSDLSVICGQDDAWRSYLEWCEANEKKNLAPSKLHRVIGAKTGSIAVNGRKGYVGLVLVEQEPARTRKVA